MNLSISDRNQDSTDLYIGVKKAASPHASGTMQKSQLLSIIHCFEQQCTHLGQTGGLKEA